MDADYEIFEIVTIIDDNWLIDAESYQRRYCTRHGQRLAPGLYVVDWPDHIRVRRFNGDPAYHGPYGSRREAQATLDRMCRKRAELIALSSLSGETDADLAATVKKAA